VTSLRRRAGVGAPGSGGHAAWRPILLVAAHPDDETIGAGALLARAGTATIVHLTDGTPRDRRFWPAGLQVAPEEYAALRRAELAEALRRGGVRDARLVALGAPDQEAAQQLPRLSTALARVLAEERPSLLVTHPYEGGHPDHDAAAFVSEAAVALARRGGVAPPVRVEMTSYHARQGAMATGTFLDADGPEVVHVLGTAERERKQRMLEAFASQQEVLRAFRADVERFRRAPVHDFTRPPVDRNLAPGSDGRLLYERWEFPVTGERWRELAGAALADLGLRA
jgi:LmbE family N-acetylglucosaminyl deacetylase